MDTLAASIDAFMAPLASALSAFVFFSVPVFGQQVPLVVAWLAIGALFFTLYLRFINIRGFWLAFRHVRGDFKDPSADGEISHFRALATAISGTVGVGNIGGVAVAISLGGAGAAFWLFVAGFLSMSTKLIECTLGVKYRQVHEDGSVSGGPMYYLDAYFRERDWPRIGRTLGGIYALALVIGCFGVGNMFQSNQAYQQMLVITGGESSFLADYSLLFGLVLATIVGLVIIGGITSIARVAAYIVPFMAGIYIVGCLVIISLSWQNIPLAISTAISSAFGADAMAGGALGALIMGFQRALFSNEAGLGSASIAHSAVKTRSPASEGLVGLLEPFIDTVVVLTLSSLVILTTALPNGLMSGGLSGIEVTSAAFAFHLPWSPYLIAVAAVLFAFSTALAWSYYGLQAWNYLVGVGKWRTLGFQLVFLTFFALGCVLELKAVLDFSDAMIFLIALPNLVALYLFAPMVKREVEAYLRETA
ncbi:MAG: amino acid carrier protein [Gammaproteobacteria bacterium]|nr:amino acid carrier protein [Gammaproteobacteria bacterium]